MSNLKQFLKPDWRKIAVLVIFTITFLQITVNFLSLILDAISLMAGIAVFIAVVCFLTGNLGLVLKPKVFGTILTIFYLILFVMYYFRYWYSYKWYEDITVLYSLARIVIFYFLSCIIVFIYDKFKKKKVDDSQTEEEYIYEKPEKTSKPKKSHKKLFVILVLSVIIAVVSYLFVFKDTITSTAKDCGTYVFGLDDQADHCYRNASLNCTQARIIYVETAGYINQFSIMGEIKGYSDNSSCLVYHKVVSGPLDMLGLEEECKVPIDVLSTGGMTPKQRSEYCSGSLTEWLKKRY